jgi:hypothetical protein
MWCGSLFKLHEMVLITQGKPERLATIPFDERLVS